MTVGRVRKHLLQEGKAEHWMIFEELALAPLIPGRAAKSREELLAMFPGEGPAFLDNRMTTVKRVFRRILPALIPVDPTESRTARAAVPGAAGDPPRLGEQPALAGLPGGPVPRPRGLRRLVASTWRPGTIGGERARRDRLARHPPRRAADPPGLLAGDAPAGLSPTTADGRTRPSPAATRPAAAGGPRPDARPPTRRST